MARARTTPIPEPSDLADPDTIADVAQALKLARAIGDAIVTTDPLLLDHQRDGGIEKLASAISAALGYLEWADLTEPKLAMYAAIARFAVRKYRPH